jgi:hypothetical protein
MRGLSKENQLLNSDFRDILSAFCEEKVEFMLVGAYMLPVTSRLHPFQNKNAVARPQDKADVAGLEKLQ